MSFKEIYIDIIVFNSSVHIITIYVAAEYNSIECPNKDTVW